MDCRQTLNLQKTAFPMKATLPVREPEWLQEWETTTLYDRQRQRRHGKPKFILHDGPPYADGDIHAGTALNKILKDMIKRFWNLEGYDVVYVPGWDTHGLPIERRVLKKLGVSQHHAVAQRYIGVMGDWDHPYVTMNPAYEGTEWRVFADMVEKGLIYRDLKSVCWCPHWETALAEGKIEHNDHESDSIYVAFEIRGPEAHDLRFLLGNLEDFEGDRVTEVVDLLNRWALATATGWAEEARASYQDYVFHPIVHSLVRLMTIDLSSFYLDVIKDRLYTLAPHDPLRRETQAVIAEILQILVRGISPMWVFTADEVYQAAKRDALGPDSVHLTEWPLPWNIGWNAEEPAAMERLLGYREIILKALEELRASKIIGDSLQAMVTLTVSLNAQRSHEESVRLAKMIMAAQVMGEVGQEVTATAGAIDRRRCERCWRYTGDVGENPQYEDLCGRCGGVLNGLRVVS